MNTTKHGRISILIDKEDFDELEQRASRSTKEVHEAATDWAKTLVRHLRAMKKQITANELADFIETRLPYVESLK